MNKNLTEIIFIIDRSGSMQSLTDDTIGGFNGVLESQRESVDGEAVVTTVLFNGEVTKLYDRMDIREVEPMTKKQYVASGNTALLDAIGKTIDGVQERIDDTPEEERPAHVICVITTDGAENASREYRKSQIQKMVTHQTKGHGWEFIFLGANMDAMSEAHSLGIDRAATYYADSIGTQTLYYAVDNAVKGMRMDGVVSDSWCDTVNAYTASKMAEDTAVKNRS